ncbi:Ig-like domain-containing protein [Caulobacter segnis]
MTVTGPPNQPPVANERWTYLNQSTSVTVDPRDGDSDPNNDPLTVTGLGSFYFAYGILNGVEINSSQAPSNIGSRSYTATSMTYNAPFVSNNPGDFFVVVAYYTVSDGHGGTAQGDEVFVVNAVAPATNQAPTTTSDSVQLTFGETAYVNVLANDSDPDGDALTITGLSTTNGSKATYAISGSSIEVIAKNSKGGETITYTISDGKGGTATGSLSVFVNNN